MDNRPSRPAHSGDARPPVPARPTNYVRTNGLPWNESTSGNNASTMAPTMQELRSPTTPRAPSIYPSYELEKDFSRMSINHFKPVKRDSSRSPHASAQSKERTDLSMSRVQKYLALLPKDEHILLPPSKTIQIWKTELQGTSVSERVFYFHEQARVIGWYKRGAHNGKQVPYEDIQEVRIGEWCTHYDWIKKKTLEGEA
eukprot:Ihof_evm19s21 gene=Ihof_evmTU19s21